MGARRAEQSTEIDGSAQDCFDAIADFESYPDWQSAVRRCVVLERDADGRAAQVQTTIDAKVREVTYVLRYHYDAPERIWWDYVEGDVKSVEGEFVFEPLDGGRTLATYRLEIDPGAFFPGPLRRALEGQVMKGAVRELKARVEEGSG